MVSSLFIAAVIFITIWEGTWKLVALWKAARRNQHGWFAAIFILNTAGILPITYLFWFQRPQVEMTVAYPYAPNKPFHIKKSQTISKHKSSKK